jgi:hypothetical protein
MEFDPEGIVYIHHFHKGELGAGNYLYVWESGRFDQGTAFVHPKTKKKTLKWSQYDIDGSVNHHEAPWLNQNDLQ